VQSVATVTVTGPPVYGLLFGLIGVVAALSPTTRPTHPPDGETASAPEVGRVET